MDPMDPPPHFNNSRTRYDPFFPPHHHFQEQPNYYPHHQHQHQHQQPPFPPLPPPPPPPPRHHRHSRDHHPHPPDDARIYFPFPHHPPDPPPFDPRVSERFLIRGPHHPQGFPREHGDGIGVRKIRVFDERPRPGPIQLEWEQEAMQEVVPTFRVNSNSKRFRIREDGILEEDFRDRGQRQVRFLDGHGGGRRVDPNFDPLLPDASLGQELPFSPRGLTRNGFVSNRGGEASSNFERRIAMPSLRSSGHPHPDFEVANGMGMGTEIGFQGNRYVGYKGGEEGFQENHYTGNKGKRKIVLMGTEDDEFQDNHYMGNKGKRKMSNGGNSQYLEWNSTKRPLQKASALGRIQSGISVWSRIEEKPSSPPPNFSPSGFLDENQPEIDSLDLSYKSNALVAKVVVPSSPAPLSSERKGPKVVTPKKRVMKKKKVVKNREKVVVPIVSVSLGPETMEGVPKKTILSSPLHVSNDSEGSEKAIVSSCKPAIGASPQPSSMKEIASSSKPACGASPQPSSKKAIASSSKPASGASPQPSSKKAIASSGKPASGASPQPFSKKAIASSIKPASGASPQPSSKRAVGSFGKPASGASSQPSSKRVTEVASVNKCAAKIPPKTVVLVESSVTEDHRQEDKGKENRPINDTSSQLCQQGPAVVITSVENSAAEQSTIDVDLVQSVGIEDSREKESMMPGEKIDQNLASSIVSDTRVVTDAGSLPFAREMTAIMTPSKTFALVDNGIAEDPIKQGTLAVVDVGNFGYSDTSLAMSSLRKSSSLGLVGDGQVVKSVGTVSSSNGGGSSKSKDVKGKRERVEEQQRLDVATVTEEFEICGEGNSELGDVLLHSHVQDMPSFFPSEVSDLVLDQNLPDGFMEKEDELPRSDGMTVREDSSVVPMNDYIGERVEQGLPSVLPEKGSLVAVFKVQDATHYMDAEQSYSQLSESKGCWDNNTNSLQNEEPTSNNDSLVIPKKLLASKTEAETKSDKTMLLHHPIFEKRRLLSSNEPKKQITADAIVTVEVPKSRKAILSSGVPKVFPSSLNSAGSLKETAHTSRNVRNKTWHRTDTPASTSSAHGNLHRPVGSSMHKQSPKKFGRVQNSSYVRKGNSLIRKPATQVPPRPSHGLGASSRKRKHVTERSMILGSKVESSDHTTCPNPCFERPKTPPLPLGSKLPNSNMDPPKDFSRPMSEDPIPEAGVEAQVGPLDNQTFDLLSGSVDNQSIASGTKSEPLNRQRMIYVKHKSNQLVAAPRPGFGDSSTHPTEKAQKSSLTSLDLYYRRKKNQLILNALSSNGQHKQDMIVPVVNSNSDDQEASKISSLKRGTTSLSKKRRDKVLRKTYKHSKFSRVWTLNGGQCKKGVTSVNRWKVTPYLFPWKRTTYCRNSASNATLNSNRHSLSLISRKLQLTRKMDTIYTVSTDGFSLRKAGVVSIGGSSLKWSKSIERHSKKANEEATLAVAEVERKKRERKRGTSIGAREKNGSCLSRKSTFGIELQQGERIFRVGSVRYKMDSSKRTLIRIPDEHSCAVGQRSGSSTFVPRRLLIGNDEYIRIGNGNQLVRDPKKLIRILASEKIRWSLHTARLRLARKQQYCQFFTRFGKCNKNRGKCPYIHDPAKVAICTKFLRGVCTDANCKLTHKVLPERMPDCSYFLQGLCTNINCPYRHVHVNPNASVCDGFLRGYCADGDECCKKHSYVCPLFEATGKCPQGSKCKLHHPRSKNNSKKRKRRELQSNSRGRYFGSNLIKVGEPMAVSLDKYDVQKGGDAFCSDGWFAEFISIDGGSDNDGFETNVQMDLNPKESDSEIFDVPPGDLDLLIKPVRIMNKANLNASIGL